MPTLTPGQPVTIEQPELLVENDLPAGRYRFQLVVTDDGGLESAPAELTIIVRGPVRPDPTGRPEPGEPVVLRPGVVRPEILRPGVLRPGIVRPIRRPP